MLQTNPLTEAERPVRLTVYEPRTTDWCPSLIKTSTTRVIQGEEADKLRQGITKAENVKKMADIARSDLAHSDDDEDLNAFGKSVRKGLSSRESAAVPVSARPQPSQLYWGSDAKLLALFYLEIGQRLKLKNLDKKSFKILRMKMNCNNFSMLISTENPH